MKERFWLNSLESLSFYPPRMLILTQTDLPKFSYGVCMFIPIAYILMYAQRAIRLISTDSARSRRRRISYYSINYNIQTDAARRCPRLIKCPRIYLLLNSVNIILTSQILNTVPSEWFWLSNYIYINLKLYCPIIMK